MLLMLLFKEIDSNCLLNPIRVIRVIAGSPISLVDLWGAFVGNKKKKTMYIKLIRNKPQGNAITGRLIVDDGQLTLDTLEPWQYAIPAGFYRLRLTYSPAFQEILPLLDGVLGYARQPHNGIRRTGIRIHAGNTIADSRGCILVGYADIDYKTMGRSGEARLLSSRKALNELREYLLNYQKEYPNEEIYIEITEPDVYPLYDVPYERELQKP